MATNTGPATISISGSAAVSLLSAAGSPLGAGELVGGKVTIIARVDGEWRVILAYSQFTFRGAWAAPSNYVPNDLTEHGGSIWLATRASAGVEPIEGVDWTFFLPGVTVADGSITVAKLAPDVDLHYLRITSDPVKDLLRIGCVAEDPSEDAANAALINTALGEMPAAGGKLVIPSQRFYVADINNFTGKSITIEGSGPELSALIPTQTSGYFLDLQQDDYTDAVRLEKFSIECETASVVRAVRVQFQEADATNNRLQGRCTLSDLEIRGSDVAAHGFLSGVDLVNVHRPFATRVNIAGRQNGTGPASFKHMTYGWNLVNSGTGTPTDYMFSFSTVLAAERAFMGSGHIEGLSFDRCYAIAVGNGFDFNATPNEWPLISIIGSHVAAFDNCILLENFWQNFISGCLLYKREDSNGETTGIRVTNVRSSRISGNTFVNAAGNPATFGNYNGVTLVDSSGNSMWENEFGGCRLGVSILGSSSNNSYVTRPGLWQAPVGTGTIAEYNNAGSGSGNTRRGQELDTTASNTAGAINISGASGVTVVELSTDTLEVGDDLEFLFSMTCNKDVNAGIVRALVQKAAGTASVTFDSVATQINASTDCPGSSQVHLRGSAKGKVTVRGSYLAQLQGFSPTNAFSVSVNGGQLQIVRR